MEVKRFVFSGTNLDPFRVYSFTTHVCGAGCFSVGTAREVYARARIGEDGAHAVVLEGSSNKKGRYIHGVGFLLGRDMTWKHNSATCRLLVRTSYIEWLNLMC